MPNTWNESDAVAVDCDSVAAERYEIENVRVLAYTAAISQHFFKSLDDVILRLACNLRWCLDNTVFCGPLEFFFEELIKFVCFSIAYFQI